LSQFPRPPAPTRFPPPLLSLVLGLSVMLPDPCATFRAAPCPMASGSAPKPWRSSEYLRAVCKSYAETMTDRRLWCGRCAVSISRTSRSCRSQHRTISDHPAVDVSRPVESTISKALRLSSPRRAAGTGARGARTTGAVLGSFGTVGRMMCEGPGVPFWTDPTACQLVTLSRNAPCGLQVERQQPRSPAKGEGAR